MKANAADLIGRGVRALALAVAVMWAGASFAQAPNIPALVSAGDYDAARAAAQERGGRLNLEITEALIDFRQGQRETAVARLRAILRARPDLVPVRRILAGMLVAMERYETAEYQYEQLLETDDDPEQRQGYVRALRRIYGLKPYGFSGGLALLPSTNLNHGSSSETFSTEFGEFIISDGSREISGIGLVVTAGGFRRVPLENGHRLQFDANASTSFYEESELNQTVLSFSASYGKTEPKHSWTLTPELRFSWRDGAAYYSLGALSYSRTFALDPKTGIGYRLRGEYRDYPDDTYLTGMRYEAEASVTRRIGPRTSLTGALVAKTGETQAERFQYDAIEVKGRVFRSWENGLILSTGISYEDRPYRGDYTGVSYARHDKVTSLNATVANDRWVIKGVVPTFSCRLIWASSNVSFYDYDSQECTIGFTRRF